MSVRKGEAIDGVLLLDKPTGITSNRALQITKRLFGAAKAGHTGCLDPLATGMLPICFGEATKFSRFFLEANKAYEAVLALGVTTTTGDSEGEIVAVKPVIPPTRSLFEDLLCQFQGTISQVPPMYSALKHQGQPLYKLARAGKAIARAARTVVISELVLKDITQSDTQTLVSLQVTCSTGTYIRTLAEDIGAAWGCGAHLTSLRRRWVSPFQNSPMQRIADLELFDLAERRAQLSPIQSVLAPILPTITLSDAAAFCLLRGQAVPVDAPYLPTEWVSMISAQGQFLGVGQMQGSGVIAPRRLVQVCA